MIYTFYSIKQPWWRSFSLNLSFSTSEPLQVLSFHLICFNSVTQHVVPKQVSLQYMVPKTIKTTFSHSHTHTMPQPVPHLTNIFPFNMHTFVIMISTSTEQQRDGFPQVKNKTVGIRMRELTNTWFRNSYSCYQEILNKVRNPGV